MTEQTIEQRAGTVPVPRIQVEAFCLNPDLARAIEVAAQDRLMANARMSVTPGGVSAAAETFKERPSPPLVIVEALDGADVLLSQLDRLAEVCDAGTKVMVIGHENDVTLYRELMRRGVSEYAVAPLAPREIIAAIAGIYSDERADKLGQVYAFIGAKGGTGSSTVAHNVAWTIGRRLGADVVIVDLDLAFGTAGLDFNLEPAQGIAEAIQDVGRLDRVLLDRLLAKYDDHVSVLAAPARLDRLNEPDPASIEALVEVAKSSVPFTVLDLPHLWASWRQRALALADQVVITAEPDLASLRNVKNMVGALRQSRPNDPPPRLILNQVGMPKRPEIKPRDFAEAIGIEPTTVIPFEAGLFGTAANNGQMIAQASARSPTAEMFARAAFAITGHSGEKRHKRGFGFGSLVAKLRKG
jgi:pilus assembly protein CpaE